MPFLFSHLFIPLFNDLEEKSKKQTAQNTFLAPVTYIIQSSLTCKNANKGIQVVQENLLLPRRMLSLLLQ